MKRLAKRGVAAVLVATLLTGLLVGTAGAATHVVVKDDTLSKLAETYLGDASRWVEIYEANKDVISNPNAIYVGQQLAIPENGAPSTPDTPAVPDTPAKEDVMLTINPNHDNATSYTLARQAGDPVLNDNDINSPARRGYSFSGWYYNAACTSPVGKDDTVKDNLTIYAGWTVWDKETAAYMELVLTEAEHARYICNRPTAYTKESFEAYQSLAAPIMFLTMGGGVFPKEMEGLVHALAGARQQLQLAEGVSDPEDTIWYIWGEDMPAAADAGNYDYYGTWDNPDFKPFLIPCMLEDQSQVKGNIILISGGGFQQRANRWEGYPAIEAFNALGYNCFLLQRRVEPSTPTDAGLDLQRSIRYLKYYAKERGISKIENLACAGYSGGAMTIDITVSQFYGDIKPTTVYPDYRCDAIDNMNSDMETMILVYGAEPLSTQNPNIPDAFVVIGVDDPILWQQSYDAMQYYRENKIRYEAHFFADAGHGFGQGFGLNFFNYTDENVENVKAWPALADTFMSIQYGYVQNVTTLGQ